MIKAHVSLFMVHSILIFLSNAIFNNDEENVDVAIKTLCNSILIPYKIDFYVFAASPLLRFFMLAPLPFLSIFSRARKISGICLIKQ